MPFVWVTAATELYGAYQSTQKPSGGGGGGGGGSPAAAADPFAGERPQYMDQLRALMAGGSQSNLGSFSGPSSPYPSASPYARPGSNPSGASPFLGMSGPQHAVNDRDPRQTYLGGGPGGSGRSAGAGATPGLPTEHGNASTQDPSYQFRLKTGEDNVQRAYAARGMGGSGNELAAISDYAQGMASTEYAAQFNRNENQFQNNYARLAQLAGANSGQPGQAGQLLQQQQGNAAAFGQQALGAIGNVAVKGYDAYNSWYAGNQGNLNTPDTSGSTTNPADWGSYTAPDL